MLQLLVQGHGERHVPARFALAVALGRLAALSRHLVLQVLEGVQLLLVLRPLVSAAEVTRRLRQVLIFGFHLVLQVFLQSVEVLQLG